MVLKVLKGILFWLATFILIICILAIISVIFFGIEFRTIITGSMEPELPVGSLVMIVPAKAEDIQVGDDIAFKINGGRVVTHRVISIDEKNLEYHTRGIANDNNMIDPPNKYENILGVVWLSIPYLGLLFNMLTTTSGKIIAVTLIIAAYIITLMMDAVIKGKSKEDK